MTKLVLTLFISLRLCLLVYGVAERSSWRDFNARARGDGGQGYYPPPGSGEVDHRPDYGNGVGGEGEYPYRPDYLPGGGDGFRPDYNRPGQWWGRPDYNGPGGSNRPDYYGRDRPGGFLFARPNYGYFGGR